MKIPPRKPDHTTQAASSGADPGETGPDPAAKPPTVPDHELLRCIGTGAYGAVWLARNIMGTYRAVKVVYRESFPEEEPYEREFRGIRAFEPVSRTQDSLIDILHVGRDDAEGFFFYVMELADDQQSGTAIHPETYQPRSLASEIQQKHRLPAAQCLELGVSLANGLNHLHQAGLVHRDIKPANIVFINGIPKIADIGLVTPMRDTVSLVGTEGYFLPGEIGTPQGDIYALGKVLYEITTGNDIKAFPALPHEFTPDTDNLVYSELNAVVLKACELNPKARYRNVGEIRSDLHLLRAGRSVKRLHQLEFRLAKIKRASVSILGAVVVALIAYFNVAQEAKRQGERRQRQVARYVGAGTSQMEQRDLMAALRWYASALELDQDGAEGENTHRVRFAATLGECPQPVRMWFESNEITAGELHAPGRIWAIGDLHGHVKVIDYGGETDRVRDLLLSDGENGIEVENIAFSADGNLMAAVGGDLAVVWERGDDQPTRILRHAGIRGTVYGVALSPDGSTVATSSGNAEDGEVRLWDRDSETSLTLTATKGAARCVSFSPHGDRLVVSDESGMARVWDLRTRRPIGNPIKHTPGGWVYHAEFSPDGTKVVTACSDKTVIIYDLESGSVRQRIAHPAMVRMAKFSPDGRYVVTAGWDYAARIWRVSDGALMYHPLKQSGKSLIYAGFAEGGRQILTAHKIGVVCLWDLTRARSSLTTTPRTFNPYSRRWAEITGGEVRLFSGGGDERPGKRLTNSFPASEVLFSPQGRHLLVCSPEQSVVSGSTTNVVREATLWDVERGEQVGSRFRLPAVLLGQADPNQARRITVNDQAPYVATCALNEESNWEMSIWDAANNAPVRPGKVLDRGARNIYFSPNGQWLAAIAGSRVVLQHLSEPSKDRELKHPDDLIHLAFSPDSRRLVACCSDQRTSERAGHVWDLETGKEVLPPLPHVDGVRFAEYSPNGTRIVTASEDNTARVWDAIEGTLICEVAHFDEVYVARFSRHGRWIVTGGRDKRARVWDADTGDPITPWLTQPWEVVDAWFLPGDTNTWFQGRRSENALRSLRPTTQPVEDLVIIAEVLSGRRVVGNRAVLLRSPEKLWNRWEQLQPSTKAAAPSIRRWHEYEAELSHQADDPDAEAFHRRWAERYRNRDD